MITRLHESYTRRFKSMSIKRFKKLVFIAVAVLWIIPVCIQAQVFDYHREESPSISWNGVILSDARMLGTGGISLMASPEYAAIVNPALIPSGKKPQLGGSFGAMQFEAFQYWGLNEGVFTYLHNTRERKFQFSGLSVTLPLKSIRIAAGWYIPNMLELPPFYTTDIYSWRYTGKFTGKEHAFYGAAAFKVGKSVDIGIKLEYVYGKRTVELMETWIGFSYNDYISQTESHRMSQLIPSIGFSVKVSPSCTIGAGVIYPLKGKTDRTFNRVFESRTGVVEITDLKSTDTLYKPARMFLGTSVGFLDDTRNRGKKRLTLAAEASYTLWSDYKYEFFSEFLQRNMKNTLVLALGAELGFFGPKSDYFLRAGYRMDPQPMKDIDVTLHGFSAGLGTRIGKISIDVGGIYYIGSSTGFTRQKHWVVNSTFGYSL
jgi:hypothetical protein